VTHEHYRDAYRYGLTSADRHADRRFEDVEPDLRAGWEAARGRSSMTWDDARGAVRHAYVRRIERLSRPATVTAAGDRTGTACDRPVSNVKA
jgi:hypothetical protein